MSLGLALEKKRKEEDERNSEQITRENLARRVIGTFGDFSLIEIVNGPGPFHIKRMGPGGRVESILSTEQLLTWQSASVRSRAHDQLKRAVRRPNTTPYWNGLFTEDWVCSPAFNVIVAWAVKRAKGSLHSLVHSDKRAKTEWQHNLGHEFMFVLEASVSDDEGHDGTVQRFLHYRFQPRDGADAILPTEKSSLDPIKEALNPMLIRFFKNMTQYDKAAKTKSRTQETANQEQFGKKGEFIVLATTDLQLESDRAKKSNMTLNCSRWRHPSLRNTEACFRDIAERFSWARCPDCNIYCPVSPEAITACMQYRRRCIEYCKKCPNIIFDTEHPDENLSTVYCFNLLGDAEGHHLHRNGLYNQKNEIRLKFCDGPECFFFYPPSEDKKTPRFCPTIDCDDQSPTVLRYYSAEYNFHRRYSAFADAMDHGRLLRINLAARKAREGRFSNLKPSERAAARRLQPSQAGQRRDREGNPVLSDEAQRQVDAGGDGFSLVMHLLEPEEEPEGDDDDDEVKKDVKKEVKKEVKKDCKGASAGTMLMMGGKNEGKKEVKTEVEDDDDADDADDADADDDIKELLGVKEEWSDSDEDSDDDNLALWDQVRKHKT